MRIEGRGDEDSAAYNSTSNSTSNSSSNRSRSGTDTGANAAASGAPVIERAPASPHELPEPSAPPLPPPSYDDVMSNVHESAAGDGAAGGPSNEAGSSSGIASSVASPSRSRPYRRLSGDNKHPPPSPDAGAGQSSSAGPPPPAAVPPSPSYGEDDPLIGSSPYGAAVPPLNAGHGSPDGLSSREFFASLEYKRSAKGYTSTDAWLNTNVQALHRFLVECNERPRVGIEVEGWHMEERQVERTYTQNGETRTETDTRSDRVVDFKFTLELTPFIHEKGNIYTSRSPTGEPYDLDKVLSNYVNTENILKEIRVQKKVIWDYDLVRREITSFIKSAGYPHHVDVKFPMENDRIVVKSHNTMAKVWRHPVTSFLCVITCACIVGWPLQYLATKKWRNKVCSDFVVVASPNDFVARHSEFIRSQVSWSNRRYPFPNPY
ncbi:hypothetical protein GGI12_003822 [Dipsacomyces acuminosporus]|nr:hypothetical protein GGI12_003822 [Dipsacomyces acuminosporus]